MGPLPGPAVEVENVFALPSEAHSSATFDFTLHTFVHSRRHSVGTIGVRRAVRVTGMNDRGTLATCSLPTMGLSGTVSYAFVKPAHSPTSREINRRSVWRLVVVHERGSYRRYPCLMALSPGEQYDTPLPLQRETLMDCCLDWTYYRTIRHQQFP